MCSKVLNKQELLIKKVMADINEYIRNYSDLTFEEYKQLKYGKS